MKDNIVYSYISNIIPIDSDLQNESWFKFSILMMHRIATYEFISERIFLKMSMYEIGMLFCQCIDFYRKKKDYANADTIRERMKESGFEVQIAKDKIKWQFDTKRIPMDLTWEDGWRYYNEILTPLEGEIKI